MYLLDFQGFQCQRCCCNCCDLLQVFLEHRNLKLAAEHALPISTPPGLCDANCSMVRSDNPSMNLGGNCLPSSDQGEEEPSAGLGGEIAIFTTPGSTIRASPSPVLLLCMACRLHAPRHGLMTAIAADRRPSRIPGLYAETDQDRKRVLRIVCRTTPQCYFEVKAAMLQIMACVVSPLVIAVFVHRR